MTYTEIDQALKDEGIVARIRTAVLRWSYLRLAKPGRDPSEDGLAKMVLRGDKRLAEIITRALLVSPDFNVKSYPDDAQGDTALDVAVENLIVAALAVKVIVVTDPDAVSP